VKFELRIALTISEL